MNLSELPTYIFYLALIALSGAGEYLHLAPTGTLGTVIGLVTGHFFGVSINPTVNKLTKSVNSLSETVQGVSNGTTSGQKTS